jgi:outer membrane translocation and assembly module TamA
VQCLQLSLITFGAIVRNSLKIQLFISLSALFIVTPVHAFGKKHSKEIHVCPNLVLSHKISSDFNSNEKRLACGKYPGDDSNLVAAWEVIPENQRRFNITNFLQARGYHHPVFTIHDDGVLWVDPGPISKVTSLEAISEKGVPSDFDYRRKRKVVGEALTPALLDDIKSWTETRLEGLGYACLKVQPWGNPDTGEVKVDISAYEKVVLKNINEDPIPHLLPGLLRRYDAFKIGDTYNGDLMTLSERRATTDGQVEGLHYRVNSCTNGELTVDQETTIGKPRLLTFGVGVSTEGVILGRASWSSTRLGNTASKINVSLTASTIHQLFNTYAEYYFLNEPSRLYLRPSVTFEHINWDPYETATASLDVSPVRTWDSDTMGFSSKLGPVYDYIRTFRTSGLDTTPPTGRYLFLEEALLASTHYYDFYQSSPRTGFKGSLTIDLNSPSFFSDYEAQRFKIGLEGLVNLNQYDPPLWVFGVRGWAASTFTENSMGSNLPPVFLQYLGGSTDMRGFGLQELTLQNGMGALSAAYLGTEVRYAGGFWFGIQPFVFMDAGALGSSSTELDSPVYLSPGIGLRVETPIGSVRTTLAHGYETGDADSHFQFFFSFGEEF